jgi:hypothetical protein
MPEPDPCIHSMLVEDCASCWYGLAVRQQAEMERLRKLLYEFDLYSFEIPGYADSPFANEVRNTLGERTVP